MTLDSEFHLILLYLPEPTFTVLLFSFRLLILEFVVAKIFCWLSALWYQFSYHYKAPFRQNIFVTNLNAVCLLTEI